LLSQTLGLALVRWEGIYQEVETRWLRWATLSGALLPTPQEVAVETQRRVTEAQRQATEAQRQATEAQHQAMEAQRQATEAQRQQAALEAQLARYRARFGDLPDAEVR
jgi:F0F1-type ATP synthase epsilon subunit